MVAFCCPCEIFICVVLNEPFAFVSNPPLAGFDEKLIVVFEDAETADHTHL